MWRVLTGRNKTITISFLPTGHTKFSPDWCFGLIKQRFRRTEVGCLNDIADVVEQSASVNTVQLVGTQEGEQLVEFHDWTGFLAPFFNRIKSIKKLHHFIIDSSYQGIVKVKETSGSSVTDLNLLKNDKPSRNDLPPLVAPRGLSAERQWYLYDRIRQFCPESCKNTTCPLPVVPRLFTPNVSPEPSTTADTTISQVRRRICGKCGQTGHNRRSCKNYERNYQTEI